MATAVSLGEDERDWPNHDLSGQERSEQTGWQCSQQRGSFFSCFCCTRFVRRRPANLISSSFGATVSSGIYTRKNNYKNHGRGKRFEERVARKQGGS